MAGGKGQTLETNWLKLIFNATPIANIADNAASSPFTQVYCAMHTANPGATGNQTTSEAAYTGYARVAVARSSGGWTVGTATVSPAATIIFPTATGGSETETYWSAGAASSGAGQIWYFGPISPSIAVSNGVTPELTTASTVTEA